MKQSLLLCFALLIGAGTYSQLTVQSGATFFIQSGATVTVQGDVNSQANIQGPGVLQMKGSALQTLNMNGFSLDNLQIDNANNVVLGGAALLNTNLTFTTGKLQLSTFDLNLSNTATITGYDATKYCISNSTGRLVRNGLSTAFTFPVGFDATTYNPITLTQNGTVDNIGVRVLANVLQGGSAGTPFVKEVVDASWNVSELTPGGSNLNMTAQWSGTDELTGFNRTKTGISFYDGVGWDMTNAMTGAAAGAGPYTVTRNAVTNLGAFAVGTRPVLISLLVSPKTFLQGPYAGGSLMNDLLRSSGVIPLTEPYTGMTNFGQSGSGGGETITAGVLATTGTGNDIVDWVLVQLRNSSTGAVITTRAALIERDGDIVDIDGTNTKQNYVNMAGEVAGSYFISIRHRNHLGIRTPGSLALSRTVTTPYNFSTGAAQALSSIQANLTGGVFGMYAGDANGNGRVSYTGGLGGGNDENELLNVILLGNKNAPLVTVYNRGDLNMNGRVSYTGGLGGGNDENVLLNIVLGGNKATPIVQPF